MTALLDIISGPHTGSSIPLIHGKFRVGRGAQADYILEGDNFLADSHFAVDVRDDGVMLQDLESLNGTFANGKRVEQTKLNDGDRIFAGHSVFGVRGGAEADSSSPRPGRLPPRTGWAGPFASPALTPAQNRVVDILMTQPGKPYVLLDAARDPKVRSFLESQRSQCQSLFEGKTAKIFSHVAPYLMLLDESACAELLRASWRQKWCVFIHSAMSIDDVRQHLRSFLVAEMPNGGHAFFRFYDPRPLRVYLHACSLEESFAFLGCNHSILMEDESPGRWICFERGPGKLKIDYAALEEGASVDLDRN